MKELGFDPLGDPDQSIQLSDISLDDYATNKSLVKHKVDDLTLS